MILSLVPFNFSLAFTHILAKILQNGAKFIQKLTPGEEFEHLETSSGKYKKFKFDGLLLFKTLYKEDISNITFNYLCENSPKFSCQFWNRYSYFTTQFHCICLAQTLHTFNKSSPSKCKFLDFPLLLTLKFTKFCKQFFKQKVSFSSKLGSLFSVMRNNSSVVFQLKHYMLLIKGAHQSANFQTFDCSHEN